jgi:hypothetical protein
MYKIKFEMKIYFCFDLKIFFTAESSWSEKRSKHSVNKLRVKNIFCNFCFAKNVAHINKNCAIVFFSLLFRDKNSG